MKGRRVQHGRDVIDDSSDIGEALPDASVIKIPTYVTKVVGGEKNVVWGQTFSGCTQEIHDCLPAVSVVGLLKLESFCVGEPYIIKLNLVKPCCRCLDCNADVVIPDSVVKGVSPGETLAIYEDRT